MPSRTSQGEDPEYKWVWMIMKYWLKLVVGILSIGVTISWILQIILYILISPPVSPLLNTAFTKCAVGVWCGKAGIQFRGVVTRPAVELRGAA